MPSVDRILELFAGVTRPESRQQHNDQRHTDSHLPHRSRGASIQNCSPPFVEITSPGPGDGKTHLLYYIVALSVLPSHFSQISINGQRGAVIVLDCDNRFSVQRLATIMRHHITSRILSAPDQPTENLTTPPPSSIDDLILSSLQQVHIFRPQSFAPLVATVKSIPDYLFNSSLHHSSSRRLACILLDSASTFLWSDRAETDLSSLPTLSPSHPSTRSTNAKRQSSHVALASALRQTSHTLSSPVIYTTWNLSSPFQRRNQDEQQTPVRQSETSLRPQLPNPWPGLPTLRLVVSRRRVRKFPSGVSAAAALRDAGKREAAVAEGRFDVFVNEWESEMWDSRIREGMREVGRGFELRITGDGVHVSDA